MTEPDKTAATDGPAGSVPPTYPAPAVAAASTSHRAQPAGIDEHGHVRRGRISRLWTGLICTAIVLIALIIFIAQNSGQVTVHFLGLDGRISLALALLLSAIAGVLLAAIPGTIRILQLRRALKRNVRNGP